MMKKILQVLICILMLNGVVIAKEDMPVGHILSINNEFNFIVINLGMENAVEKGTVFVVFRDKKFLGKVIVEEVFPKMSSCIIIPEWKQEKFKVNDGVLVE